MKHFRRRVPSLDALVFFEAAGRHTSFTAAAAELFVTQAAVSKRIKELEAHLDLQLFHREGRGLSLTDAGRRLYERTAMALEYLDDAIASETDAAGEVVQIAANSAISLFWLGPKLREIGLESEAGAIRLLTSDRLRDLIGPDNDLAVTYGHGDIPGWESTPLFSEELVPVAHPDYLPGLGLASDSGLQDLGQVRNIVLLDYQRLAPDWVNWKVWIDKLGVRELTETPRRRCPSYARAIGEAIAGQGIALGSRGLIDRELDAGHLATVGALSLRTGRGYFLSLPSHKKTSVAAAHLKRALLAG